MLADLMISQRPAIDELVIDRPVFITGMHRTGTTFLQGLLALHPELRAPALWELMHPADAAGNQRESDQLIAATQAYVDDYYRAAPDFRAIHFLDASRPEECHRLIGGTFRSMIYQLRYHIPSYGTWLGKQDLTAAYLYHRRLTRCILARLPGRRVLFKCPTHLLHLRALATAYPDAFIIRLHRTPEVTIPSACSLTATIRAARSRQIDRLAIGRQWIEWATQLIGPAQAPEGESQRTLDIRYTDLTRHTQRTLREICAFADVRFTDAFSKVIQRYQRERRADAYGQHRYTPEEFGLTTPGLRERFASYRTQFGLEHHPAA